VHRTDIESSLFPRHSERMRERPCLFTSSFVIDISFNNRHSVLGKGSRSCRSRSQLHSREFQRMAGTDNCILLDHALYHRLQPTVDTAGRPSGIAATARLTAVMNMLNTELPYITPTINIIPTTILIVPLYPELSKLLSAGSSGFQSSTFLAVSLLSLPTVCLMPVSQQYSGAANYSSPSKCQICRSPSLCLLSAVGLAYQPGTDSP